MTAPTHDLPRLIDPHLHTLALPFEAFMRKYPERAEAELFDLHKTDPQAFHDVMLEIKSQHPAQMNALIRKFQKVSTQQHLLHDDPRRQCVWETDRSSDADRKIEIQERLEAVLNLIFSAQGSGGKDMEAIEGWVSITQARHGINDELVAKLIRNPLALDLQLQNRTFGHSETALNKLIDYLESRHVPVIPLLLENLLNRKRIEIICRRGSGIENHPEIFLDDINAYDEKTTLEHLVRHLPSDPTVSEQYTRKAVWITTLINRMGTEKLLAHGFEDSLLSKLYLNTGDKAYLEDMAGAGLEETFAQQLGL